MKNYLVITLAILLASALYSCIKTDKEQLTPQQLVPRPSQIKSRKGVFTFTSKTSISYEQNEQKEIAEQLSNLFTQSAGFTLEIKKEKDLPQADICLKINKELPEEGYKLDITPTQIRLEASEPSGFFYGVQSLRQLLPPCIESAEIQKETQWSVPALSLQDAPRFSYRGLMLDVSRFFIPKENVMKIIDCMGMLKINKLHLHLVDGNGWRLEIKKYPRLTEIGAWRVYREADFAQRKNATPDEPTPVGGFYTQEDMKEIIQYAATRQVEIIPEIEMPAHTNSSLAAYPELACPVVKKPIYVIPGMGAQAANIVYCAGNENTFLFLQHVIDEVAALFPSPYIHLGGDEASKENWSACPRCQTRMKQENYTDIEELQGYFMRRMSQYVHSKGKQAMGWDELTNSTLPENAIIYGWQGMGNAGYKAGKQGHSFIMTPAKVLYLIRYQGPQWFEPRTYFGNNTLKDVYTYEPMQPEWEAEAAAHLLGVQASLWTEFVDSPKDVEYLLFPRLAALAEIAWTDSATKDWPNFLTRLDLVNEHLGYLGINYARSMYNLDHKITSQEGSLNVSISCIRPDITIRYTTDGSIPTATATLYEGSQVVSNKQTINAASFSGDKRMGSVLTLPIQWNKATAKPVLSNNDDAYRITNGLRGSDKHSDFEWCGWHGKDGSFCIDLQESQPIKQVLVGCITNYGMAVHLPKSIRLSISDNNKEFTIVETRHYTPAEIFKEGIRQENQVFDSLSVQGRYLKVELTTPGKCPDNHTRPGQNTWVYIDEVQVF